MFQSRCWSQSALCSNIFKHDQIIRTCQKLSTYTVLPHELTLEDFSMKKKMKTVMGIRRNKIMKRNDELDAHGNMDMSKNRKRLRFSHPRWHSNLYFICFLDVTCHIEEVTSQVCREMQEP